MIKRFHSKKIGMFTLAMVFFFAQHPFAADFIDGLNPTTAEQLVPFTLTITLTGTAPPAPLPPTSVVIGGTSGGNIQRSESTVNADFTLPTSESIGLKDVTITFPGDGEGDLVSTKTDAFTVTGDSGSLTVTIQPANANARGAKWSLGDGTWYSSGDTATPVGVGSQTIIFGAVVGWTAPADKAVTIIADQTTAVTGTYSENSQTLTFPVVDTAQHDCSSDTAAITCPSSGEAFYGQDAQHDGYQHAFQDNGDGTISDLVTGLMWQQTADTDGDGDIDAADKLTHSQAQSYCQNLVLAGYEDWQLPDIKTLYSLMDFRGIDPSSYSGTDTSVLTPFIDNSIFDYNWGDTAAGERVIDSQYASDTLYVDTSANMGGTLFGVNFADGRIKGYGLSIGGQDKTFYCMCVRENTSYGQNDFVDNGDGTITDNATGLMWAQADNGSALNWEAALAWVETQNAANYLGYGNWRLPNIKELQSIVDYTRSPATTSSPAIDPLFTTTPITNEANETDYPYFWSSTTHVSYPDTVSTANYISFGRALGYIENSWQDVHGAGAQRSDPKSGDPADYPTGHGPQGDAIRIYNYVRLVRDVTVATTTQVDLAPIYLLLFGE